MMKRLLVFWILMCFLESCNHEQVSDLPPNRYPKEVEKIIIGKCATSGCHNTVSSEASAGLDLSTWDHMFEGTVNGATTIPFRTDFSTLLYYTNKDISLGLISEPRMPLNNDALTTEEYNILKNWIAAGAPDLDGNIKFSGDPNRRKYYVINQGCDVVSVLDASQKVVMRMVDVGVRPGAVPPESPHDIKVTPDGKYWVVVFLNSDTVQVFSTATDELVRNIGVGNGISGGWNTLTISSDSKTGYVIDYDGGRFSKFDIDAGSSVTVPGSAGSLPNLHGCTLNKTDDTLYVTCQELSSLIKFPLNDLLNYQFVNLKAPMEAVTLKPHAIDFSPDYSKYYVTCQNTNEVRSYATHNDSLLAVISVGVMPLEMAVSDSRNLLFVTNQEDNTFPGIRGSISVIDISTDVEITKVKSGWQPHGILVDEDQHIVIVANRNYSGGVAPHHSSACAGNNGYLTAFDLNMLQLIAKFKPELSVDPYEMDVRK